jgi:hypothetical protein
MHEEVKAGTIKKGLLLLLKEWISSSYLVIGMYRIRLSLVVVEELDSVNKIPVVKLFGTSRL